MERTGLLTDGNEVFSDRQLLPVVYYGSDAVQQVLIYSPAGAEMLGDTEDIGDVLCIATMDVASPFGITLVYAASQ
jgi:hypothetical protein